MATHLTRAEIRGARVEAEARIPRLGREAAEWAHAGSARVVDENVDTAELVDGALNHAHDLLFLFDVCRHRHATSSRRIVYCRSRFSQFFGCAASDDNVGTVMCKEPCGGGADAGSATGDDGDSTSEVVRI